MRFIKFFGLLTPVILSVFFTFPLAGQAIEADVVLTLELLPLEKQEKLQNFAETIEIYLNEYDWTGDGWDEPIPVTISLQLQEASTSFEDRYAGTFMISNNNDMQYYDKYWRFAYNPQISLEHGGPYHPFTGFIDFYVYLILGGEYDKLGEFKGQIYYEKAKQVSDQAMFDAQFQSGWRERVELIDHILEDEYKAFRKMKDTFYLGLSYLGDKPDAVKKYCAQAIDQLDKLLARNPEHKDARNFLKAHHIEIIDIFKQDPNIIQTMINIDPERKETYRKYLR